MARATSACSPCLAIRVEGLGGTGAARAEDAQGTPTQSHISPSILAYEDQGLRLMGMWRDGGGGIKVRSDGGSDDGLRDVSLFSLDECECVCVCVCV